jgi:hypothetical protein
MSKLRDICPSCESVLWIESILNKCCKKCGHQLITPSTIGTNIYGNKCEKCPGIVVARTLTNYKTKVHGHQFIVPTVLVGECNQCKEHYVSVEEWNRWDELYEEHKRIMIYIWITILVAIGISSILLISYFSTNF